MAKHRRKKIIRTFHGRVFYMDPHRARPAVESQSDKLSCLMERRYIPSGRFRKRPIKEEEKKGRNVIQSLLSGRAELMPASRVGVCI
jgi:hypothetical protein